MLVARRSNAVVLFCALLLPQLSFALSSLLDLANMALQNSPSSHRFVTNTMCPFAQKVHLSLEASQTPYEMEEISLYGSNGKPDWFLKLNPKGTVPVLVSHGGAAVYPDSDVVLDQYEAGNLKGMTPIYPPGDRQDVRECIKTWRNRINAMLPDGKAAVLGGDMTAALQQHLAIMNKAVEGPYLASQRVTTADCHAFPFVWRLSQEYPSAFEKDFTALRDWLDLCGEQTAFARTIQPNWWWWW